MAETPPQANSLEVSVKSISTGMNFPFEMEVHFETSKILAVNVSSLAFFGLKQENLTVKFNKDHFKSVEGATLYTDLVWTHPYKIPVLPEMLEAGGEVVDKTLTITIVVFLAGNSLMGGSSELLWGMINTLQIFYYFPLLSMYFPSDYAKFLSYLQVANMDFKIPIESEYSDRLFKNIAKVNSLTNSNVTNEKFIEEEYENTSILTNIGDVSVTLMHGMVSAGIMLTLKAIFITMSTMSASASFEGGDPN
jgi:hypothetical protein